ncbi:uncharacterized protein BP01DRAFT_197173 [Aspergillus saccharolyticus JOP 1030-1]|uniref:Uncharacterized protein n=1 Tax=Aspergillus saccharolyticus JOP 1030-1 TaxID=1450539 RepID=A0A318ZJR1_9EURO|nr:hypothetical protein BP01DRAFT_197173 [Aspergillus saccharolyticus JOP 1030-1]PYH47769.1 hypothetical protein BP01DRAFT_197173 [Aspergillus saccharolyticus JOP 1030-1]
MACGTRRVSLCDLAKFIFSFVSFCFLPLHHCFFIPERYDVLRVPPHSPIGLLTAAKHSESGSPPRDLRKMGLVAIVKFLHRWKMMLLLPIIAIRGLTDSTSSSLKKVDK